MLCRAIQLFLFLFFFGQFWDTSSLFGLCPKHKSQIFKLQNDANIWSKSFLTTNRIQLEYDRSNFFGVSFNIREFFPRRPVIVSLTTEGPSYKNYSSLVGKAALISINFKNANISIRKLRIFPSMNIFLNMKYFFHVQLVPLTHLNIKLKNTGTHDI